ncbi:MAG: hypothetical protein JW920_09275, partial [Deltaproteobacteria bacterium]|nr:hypothetical protein [Deltaproteobacteria bacterium]
MVEIEDIGFPFLMKHIIESNFSGILFVKRNHWSKGLIFNAGNLCAIQSNKSEELFGNLLVEQGFINEDENAISLKKAKIEMKKQGVVLLEMEIIQPDVITHALRHQLETRFLDIFAWYAATIQKIKKPDIDKRPELSNEEFSNLIRKGIMEYTPFSQIITALSQYQDMRPRLLRNSFPRDMDNDIDNIIHYNISEAMHFGQNMPRALLGLFCTGVIAFEKEKHTYLVDK